MTRGLALACAMVFAAACGKPSEKKRTGPININIDVKNFDRDTACTPEWVKFEIKSEPKTTIRIAGIEGRTDARGVWLASVASATLRKLAATNKRIAVTATRKTRSGNSSYSLHLVGKSAWIRRYPKGLERVKDDANGWDSTYLGCQLVKARPSAGRATILEGELVHWVIPYAELSRHVRFSGNKAGTPQAARVLLEVTDSRGRSEKLARTVSVVGERYTKFLARLKHRATKANADAPAYRRGKGPHALLYFDGKDKLDASLAPGRLASEVALVATSKNRYRANLGPGKVTSCVYRTGNSRQEVPLLRVDPTIRVYSARTGKQIAKRSFSGRAPTCPTKLSSVADPGTGKHAPLDSVLGAVPENKIKAWLKSVAEQR